MLVPNNLSYFQAIESYIFKWVDIHTGKVIGGFDLIKITSCFINNSKENNFFIETFDGKYHRLYEIETSSIKMSCSYVHSLNYLVRLEKCKVYSKKYSLY